MMVMILESNDVGENLTERVKTFKLAVDGATGFHLLTCLCHETHGIKLH